MKGLRVLASLAVLVLHQMLPAMALAQSHPLSGPLDGLPDESRPRENSEPAIGVASMEEDGTIVLRLIARGPGGLTGEGLLRYPRSHPQYKEILHHIGPMKPGESRPVSPWPD